MSYARSPRGVSSTMYGISVIRASCARIMQPVGCNSSTSMRNRLVAQGGMDAVEREVMVPATPAEVWPVVTQSGEVSAWFGADAEIDVRPGGRGVFRWPDGT